jgi:hypothetical protein
MWIDVSVLLLADCAIATHGPGQGPKNNEGQQCELSVLLYKKERSTFQESFFHARVSCLQMPPSDKMRFFLVPLLAAVPSALGLERPDGVGKLPALGWNSWNAYQCNINEAVVLGAAQKMIDLGLKVIKLLTQEMPLANFNPGCGL